MLLVVSSDGAVNVSIISPCMHSSHSGVLRIVVYCQLTPPTLSILASTGPARQKNCHTFSKKQCRKGADDICISAYAVKNIECSSKLRSQTLTQITCINIEYNIRYAVLITMATVFNVCYVVRTYNIGRISMQRTRAVQI